MLRNESLFEKDPQLRKSDNDIKQNNASESKWSGAMKGVPSFSEHMKRLNAEKANGQNAFKAATGSNAQNTGQSNAFCKSGINRNESLQAPANNAIHSTSNVQTMGRTR